MSRFQFLRHESRSAERLALFPSIAASEGVDPFDPSAVPNSQSIIPEIRKAFPYGIATDFGRTGYGYRKDLIEERPTTWKELWELAARICLASDSASRPN